MAEHLFSKDQGMEIRPPFKNLFTLREVLPVAEEGGYALGSFAPRSTVMIRPVLRAGQKAESPLIVQISQKELKRHAVTPAEFASEFFAALQSENITIPVVLHLDHTWDFSLIQESIAAGFTKVNIATDLELAALQALGRKDHLTDAELKALPSEEKARAQAAVEATVLEKIHTFLGSAGKAWDFLALMQ